MAIKRICDICGKEIRGNVNTVKGYNNTMFGFFEIFERDLCDECFKDVQENTLKKS